MLWVSSDILEVDHWLIIVLRLAMPTVIPDNLDYICIIIHLQASSSHVSNNYSSVPAYSQVDKEGIRRALDTLQDCLSLCCLFEEMPMEDLWSEL